VAGRVSPWRFRLLRWRKSLKGFKRTDVRAHRIGEERCRQTSGGAGGNDRPPSRGGDNPEIGLWRMKGHLKSEKSSTRNLTQSSSTPASRNPRTKMVQRQNPALQKNLGPARDTEGTVGRGAFTSQLGGYTRKLLLLEVFTFGKGGSCEKGSGDKKSGKQKRRDFCVPSAHPP